MQNVILILLKDGCIDILCLLNIPARLVDHEDGNTLNNQRYNLRVGTHQGNSANSISFRKYKGVFKTGNKFGSKITVNYKTLHLGCFATEIDAAVAYNKAALKYFGEFAKLNEV